MDPFNRRHFIRTTGMLALGAAIPWKSFSQRDPEGSDAYDVVVYGGTSGGVMAAVQAARMGRTVALIEPGKHLGGLTSGGLGWVDVGDPKTIGGLAREYFHRVWKHYQDDAAWKWEPKHKMAEQHAPLPPDDQTMWIVEPSVAERLFDQMAEEARVTVVKNERLDRRTGVKMKNGKITAVTMESGRVFQAKMFIDATYEGDLMAAANVSYVVGREPNSRYREVNNGIRPLPAAGRFPDGIDPYRVKGDPGSGLLPRVYPDWGGKPGEGDKGVQAYNYRLCLTDLPENRVPFEKPAGYQDEQYELLFRFIAAGGMNSDFFRTALGGSFLKSDPLPNRKTDTNNNGYISTDFVGMNRDYPEADYAARERIAAMHEQWQRGFIWTLQHHPRIPAEIRRRYAPWGLAKDEFADNGHWPFQLYIREARRMVGDVVITEHTALGREVASDPVALGSYHMDSHAIKLFVAPNGYVTSEGGMFVHIPAPFGISYRAIVPKRGECRNLLVPVCASVTHAAYGSVRMEPVFMVLGQSAATAASLAIERDTAVQEVPYALLKTRLLADRQIIAT
ncbi:FAD-dependent oxidoreductase [Chitinophaga oryzae]|uniref:FAD-dependent oxidoreductase n=1 Tax=Chitinophaga oryzae TaxID=2725414 RepID=A0AAE7D644_9BACT|nr:FAD-dependent oxidoreductase [Chitinophaga oryzae]QJB30764.1 FAD-dependent oxidoreductase [Chitinophaga oryzae]QJB37265.1 FAD-dependent oxidoreductase [Chitinophaga oryzae]